MGSFFKRLVVIRIDGRLSIKPWKEPVNFSRALMDRVVIITQAFTLEANVFWINVRILYDISRRLSRENRRRFARPRRRDRFCLARETFARISELHLYVASKHIGNSIDTVPSHLCEWIKFKWPLDTLFRTIFARNFAFPSLLALPWRILSREYVAFGCIVMKKEREENGRLDNNETAS